MDSAHMDCRGPPLNQDDEITLLIPSHSYDRAARRSSWYKFLGTLHLNEESINFDAEGYELRSISSHPEPQSVTGIPSKASTQSGYTPLLPPNQPTLDSEQDLLFKSQINSGGKSYQRRKVGWFFSGWRVGVAVATCAAAIVLLLNLLLTIWASTSFPMTGGIGTLIGSDCNKTKSWARWLHLAINALSTILLSASNYTMQTLMAPTRQEVDKAHAKEDCLVIGTPGVHNLKSISRKRLVLFILITISSAPLHLMYNSAVFDTLSARIYSVFVVTESFLGGAEYNENLESFLWKSNHTNRYDNTYQSDSNNPYSGSYPFDVNLPYDGNYIGWVAASNWSNAFNNGASIFLLEDSPLVELQSSISTLTWLSPSDCIAAYGSDLVTERGSVLAVTSSTIADNSMSYIIGARNTDSLHGWYRMQLDLSIPGDWNDPLAWICGFQQGYDAVSTSCNPATAQANASTWTIFNQTIEYCLSQPKDSICTLDFSLAIMIAVIIMNAIKVACMALTLWTLNEDPHLVTVGDAAASFLEDPDPKTKELCLITKTGFETKFWRKNSVNALEDFVLRPFSTAQQLWVKAPYFHRWTITSLLFTAALCICGSLLRLGLRAQSSSGGTSLSDLWKLGFGSINARSLIQWEASGGGNTLDEPLLAMILVANAPQLLLSLIYCMYNTMFTSMLLEDEWQRFMIQRKPLRVTNPKGEQQSTYFLSLPYHYALPMMIVSALLHWLVSQSIFLARITILDEIENVAPIDIFTTCGWSSIAIIFAILVVSLMLLAIAAMGSRRFKGSMPIMGGCSAVISAACHTHDPDRNTSLLPVQWGVVNGGEQDHCTLSSRAVHKPVPGQWYT